MSDIDKGRDYLKTTLKEATKMHREFDGSNRVITQYDAPTTALDGEPCLKTTYQYLSTTNIVSNFKEEVDAWDSSWDI